MALFQKPHPAFIYCFLASLVVALFGFDTGSIGPITTMESFKEIMGDFSDTMHGVVVSSSLITGAISASVAGVIADRYGRTRVAALGAIIDGIGAAIECGSPNLGVFIFGRLLKGTGDGIFLSTAYVQVSEMSPVHIRGVLSSIPQFVISGGIVAGYFTCYGTANIHSSLSWRLPLAIATVLSFLFAAAIYSVPPSPRWLLARGDIEGCRAVVQRLGIPQEEQDELLGTGSGGDGEGGDATTALQEEMNQSFSASMVHMLHNFREAFSPQYRSRTIFGCFIMAMQQFAGIDGVLYYAPIMFKNAGLTSNEASFLASGISAILIFVTSFPATYFADSWGRRTAALSGGVAITLIMYLMGSVYAADQVHPDHGAGRWVIIVCIYLFAMAFNVTWANGFRIYLVEGLPRKIRSGASSLAQSANWIANYIVALITPVLLASSSYGAYFFFGSMSLICTIGVFFCMIETRGRTLEGIEEAYSRRQSQEEKKRHHIEPIITEV